MICAIHQPNYIPWLGLYYKIYKSDVFVYLDDAQYSNQADHNVNKIKTSNGEFRIKVPVEQHLGDLICEVRTKDELKWKDKHLKTLQMNYGKAEFFKEVFPDYSDVLLKKYSSISEMNMAIDKYICDGFGINTKIVKSSDFNIHSSRERKVLDICKTVGASEYLSGNGARVYQKEENFLKEGIKLTYTEYKPIEYKQVWKGFAPCMSAIDYIFNCGFDWNFVIEEVRRLNNVV